MARYDKPYLRNIMRLVTGYVAYCVLLALFLPVGCSAVTDLFWASSYDGPIPTLPGPVDDSGVLLPTKPEPTSPRNNQHGSGDRILIDQFGNELESYGEETCATFYSWPLKAGDWNGNGALDMQDETMLCVVK